MVIRLHDRTQVLNLILDVDAGAGRALEGQAEDFRHIARKMAKVAFFRTVMPWRRM